MCPFCNKDIPKPNSMTYHLEYRHGNELEHVPWRSARALTRRLFTGSYAKGPYRAK